MLDRLRKFLNKPTAPEPDLNQQIVLEGYDKQFFEKALKLYIFSRHVSDKHISDELAQQLEYCGHVVYSLITSWLRDGKPSLEYLDFLNTRMNALRALPKEALIGLEIRPSEIDELELMQLVRLKFTDDETESRCYLEYAPEIGLCRFGFT
jgi:hypothetical protein